MMPSPIRVALIAGDAPLRRACAQLLSQTPGFSCGAAFGSAPSALHGIAAAAPDVILLEMRLPNMSGAACIPQLKALLPNAKVVMLTPTCDRDLIFEALEKGADGCLLQRLPLADVLRAIQEVHAGGAPMSSPIARIVVQSFQRPRLTPAPLKNLTPREEAVLRCVSQGMVNKEIADQLQIAIETTRGHLKNIYAKLQVRSRTEAAMKYFR